MESKWVPIAEFCKETGMPSNTAYVYKTRGIIKHRIDPETNTILFQIDSSTPHFGKIPDGYITVTEYASRHGVERPVIHRRIYCGNYKRQDLLRVPGVRDTLIKKDAEMIDKRDKRGQGLLTCEQFAKKYGIGYSVVRKRVRQGKIPSIKIEKWLYIPEDYKPETVRKYKATEQLWISREDVWSVFTSVKYMLENGRDVSLTDIARLYGFDTKNERPFEKEALL